MAKNKYYLGIDAGSSYIKLVLIDSSGQWVAQRLTPRGPDIDASCSQCFEHLLKDSGIEKSQIASIMATGYGRRQIRFADEIITEITALAVGAYAVSPAVRFVIDVGGQDSKVIAMDASGSVLDFAMNQKCAAGTGKFLEVTSASLGVGVEDLGLLSGRADKALNLTSTCTVFAESEIISYIAQGEKIENVIKALHSAISAQVSGLFHQTHSGDVGNILFTGGVALNEGMVAELSSKLGQELTLAPLPQYISAYGAALFLKNKHK